MTLTLNHNIFDTKMEGLCKDCANCETDDETGLISAAQSGHDKCVDILIKAEADVNGQNETGNTALVLAARYGHDKCVELLIKAGADVNKQILNGNTALKSASFRGHKKCVWRFC